VEALHSIAFAIGYDDLDVDDAHVEDFYEDSGELRGRFLRSCLEAQRNHWRQEQIAAAGRGGR
jgi:hypothetical protein